MKKLLIPALFAMLPFSAVNAQVFDASGACPTCDCQAIETRLSVIEQNGGEASNTGLQPLGPFTNGPTFFVPSQNFGDGNYPHSDFCPPGYLGHKTRGHQGATNQTDYFCYPDGSTIAVGIFSNGPTFFVPSQNFGDGNYPHSDFCPPGYLGHKTRGHQGLTNQTDYFCYKPL